MRGWSAVSIPAEGLLILGGLVVVAAVCDVRTGRIPNGLLLVIAGLGVAAQLAFAGPLPGLASAAGGLATGLAIWIAPFALRWVGAADVKLAAAIGAWLGPLLTLEVSLYTGLAGGLMSLAYLAVTRRTAALQVLRLQLTQFSMTRRFLPGTEEAVRQRGMPYAVAILAGLLVGLL